MLNNAAAAAKSLQLRPTLCDPMDGSLPGSTVPGRQEHWSGLPLPSPSEAIEHVKKKKKTKTLRTPNDLDFPSDSDGKASAYNVGDLDSIPWSERFSGDGNGNPLRYSPWGRKESDMTKQLHFTFKSKETWSARGQFSFAAIDIFCKLPRS